MTVYFCHLPRTGGTTISHLFEQKWPDAVRVSSAAIPPNPANCYYGHFNYTPRPGVWITFIREPVERLTALYNHYLTHFPNLSQAEFLDKVGPNPMLAQLGALTNFDFVGNFADFTNEVHRMAAYLNISPVVIRHTHQQNKPKVPLVVPSNWLALDIAAYTTQVLK